VFHTRNFDHCLQLDEYAVHIRKLTPVSWPAVPLSRTSSYVYEDCDNVTNIAREININMYSH